MASHTSASASGQGLAHSRTSSAAISSRRSRSQSAAAMRAAARCSAEVAPQAARPASASATAASTSAEVATAAWATTRSGAPGSVLVSAPPERAPVPMSTGTSNGSSASTRASASDS